MRALVTGRYQFMPDLSPEGFAALTADIGVRGALTPIDVDEEGIPANTREFTNAILGSAKEIADNAERVAALPPGGCSRIGGSTISSPKGRPK